jgi:hypothetical protein
MDKKQIIQLSAIVIPFILISLFVRDLAKEGNAAAAGLGGLIAAIVIAAGGFLLRNKSLAAQVIVSVCVTVIIIVLIRVTIVNDPVHQIKEELRGSWKSVATDDPEAASVTLSFLNDHDVEIELSNTRTCRYEITRSQELIITDNVTTTTYEILHLKNDSLHLKMEFEILQFVRED